jgi:tetratricopeptide (TPR) repeat protein
MLKYNYQIDKKEAFSILIIFIIALLFRALYFNDYKNTVVYPLLPYSDGYFYFLWGKDIASLDILGSQIFMKWPLYAYLLGLFFRISNNSVFSVYALQFLLGAVNCILVYFIAKTVFNKIAAFIAALLSAFYGLFIFYDGLLIYITLSIFLNSLLFLFFLHIQNKPNKKNLLWAGVFTGLCTLAQANIITFGILASFWVSWQSHQGLKKILYNFFYFLVGLCVILGLVAVRNYHVGKDLVLLSSSTGFNFFLGNNLETDGLFRIPEYLAPTADGMLRDSKIIAKFACHRDLKVSEVSGYWLAKAAEFIKNNPVMYLKLLFSKVVYLFSPKAFIYELEYYFLKDNIRVFRNLFMDLRFILPFAVLGAALCLKEFKKTALLYLILLSLALNMVLFFVQEKFRIAMTPFLIIFAAYAMFSLWHKIKKKDYRKFLLLCLLPLSIFILSKYDIFAKYRSNYTKENYLNSAYHLQKALLYEGSSDFKNALVELRLAEQIKPDYHYTLFTFGLVYYRMNDPDMAESKFREAIRVCPFFADAYYNLGVMYNRQKRFDEAVIALEKVVSLDSDDFAARFELGKAYKARGEFKKAGHELSLAAKKINRWRSEEKALIEKEMSEIRK